MSQSTNAARAPRTVSPERYGQGSPQLLVIEGTKGQTRRTVVPVLMVIAALFFLAIVVPLVVNTDMASMAYDIRDQRVVLNEQLATIETLEGKLLEEESTRSLEKKAADIGMVPAGTVGVISLEDHEILGGVPAQ